MLIAEGLLNRHFEATRRRDIDGIVADMHPDIAFPDLLLGGEVVGMTAARAYFARQLEMADFDVSLMRLRPQPDDWFHADVEINLHRPDGGLWSQYKAVIAYQVRDGLIVNIDPLSDLAS